MALQLSPSDQLKAKWHRREADIFQVALSSLAADGSFQRREAETPTVCLACVFSVATTLRGPLLPGRCACA